MSGRPIINIYDTYTGKIIHKGIDIQTAAKLLDTSSKNISWSGGHNSRIHGRYKIIRAGYFPSKLEEKEKEKEEKDTLNKDFAKEWNEIRNSAEIIRNGVGRIVTKKVNGKIVKYIELYRR